MLGGSLFMQSFLLLNAFVMGVLLTLAFRHAMAHFRPHRDAEATRPHPKAPALPPAVKEKLLAAVENKFQHELEHSIEELQHDLQKTTTQLTGQLEKLGNDIVSDEMKRYKATLDQLREQTETTLASAQLKIASHQGDLDAKLAEQRAALEAKLTEEMAVEKERLIAQLDTRLADAVASFLTETLQHNVDLGAQTDYLTAMLNEHKDDFKREVTGETPTTK